jgi:hypothetical protein
VGQEREPRELRSIISVNRSLRDSLKVRRRAGRPPTLHERMRIGIGSIVCRPCISGRTLIKCVRVRRPISNIRGAR